MLRFSRLWPLGVVLALVFVACGDRSNGDASVSRGSGGTAAGTAGRGSSGDGGARSGAAGRSGVPEGGAAGEREVPSTGGKSGSGGKGGASGRGGTGGTGGEARGGMTSTAGTGGHVTSEGGAGGESGEGGEDGLGGEGGAGPSCRTVVPTSDWIFLDGGSPGEYAAFAAYLEPNLGGPETDLFLFEFYWNGGDGASVGTFQLGSGGDANFSTCARCFFIHSSGKDLLAASGSLEIRADSTQMDGVIHATLRDATFVEVTIDPMTVVSTPVPNGLCANVETLDLTYP